MPLTFFTGSFGDEQAIGQRMDNGIVDVYAINRARPTEMFYLGGHRVDDAPSYNLSEVKIVPEYIVEGGRNKVVEVPISTEYVLSTTMNLMLPNKLISVAERIYQLQSGCEFDLVFNPRNCGSGCDQYFWLGENIKLGTTQITSAITGYQDNEGAITRMKTVRISGQLKNYYGLETKVLSDTAEVYNTVAIIEELCEGCTCPFEILARGGLGAVATAPILEVSTDGGATWTAVTTTAIGVDNDITDILYVNGRLLVSWSDVTGGTGADGGVAWVDGYAGTVALSDMGATASLGVHALVAVGSKVYAFGTAGQIYFSCDNGLTFTNITNDVTEDFLDAALDTKTGNIYLAASNSEAYLFSSDEILTQIDGQFTPTAATDLVSVAVFNGGVAFGGANGNYYETFGFGDAGSTWYTYSLGTDPVSAIATDRLGYRVIANSGVEVYLRDINTQQNFVSLTTLTGDLTELVAGKKLLDEGTNYFIGVTDAGETVRIAACNICLESGC
jgi:hypothetical protein